MSKKKQIYSKLKIMITREFEDPQRAFDFFDKNADGKLSKKEIKSLLSKAEVSGFLGSIVASKMISSLDKSDDKQVSWKEFKKVAKELMEDETLDA